MRSHTIPFENRWTNGERAWEWSRELDRLGVPNVRAMFCDHEMHHGQESSVVSEIPAGFVRDWLAFHDQRVASEQFLWRAAVLVLGFVAATAAVFGALR
jgi:hypothetical protein